jgi:pimeloyl-ACP methyl ester carboxylesterase
MQSARWRCALAAAAALIAPIIAAAQQPGGEPRAGAAPLAASAKQVLVFGQHIRYIEAGTGPAVVLVHGLADDTGVWQQQIAPLARRWHVLALDQIGFGGSDKPLLDYRAETLVDFLDEFLRKVHVAHATVIGNSLGGWVGALLAIEHPEQVGRLVLIDAAGLSGLPAAIGHRQFEALRLSTLDDLRVLGPLTFVDPRFYQPEDALRRAFAERVAAHDGYTVGRIIDSLERGEDLLDSRIGKITQPTLVIWGREDRLIPLRFGERLRSAIHGARLVVLDQCGHEPQVECAPALEPVLESFLAQ